MGEDKHQCTKGEAGRGCKSICTRGVFYPGWDGKIHPCADQPWNSRDRDWINTAGDCLQRQEEIRLYF